MSQLISENVKNEMDKIIEKIGDNFSELISIMRENGIEPNRLEFMKRIATIIDNCELSQYITSNSDSTYENWIKHSEICEDTEIVLNVLLKDGQKFSLNGIHNLAENSFRVKEDLPEILIDIDSSEIISASFEWEGDTIQVCKECFESVIVNNRCESCGKKY